MLPPGMATGCFISTGRSLSQALERVALADSLGYEAVYTTHTAGRDSLTVLAAYAQSSKQIMLGSGVVPIYSRTPATMAQTAVTLDELSAGRMRLGLGVSHRPVVEAWHGQTIDRPVAEMREYVAILRAMFAGEDPPQGDKWKTSFHLHGVPGTQRAADLHRRPLPRHAAPRRRGRRRRDPVAVQPQLHRAGGRARAG